MPPFVECEYCDHVFSVRPGVDACPACGSGPNWWRPTLDSPKDKATITDAHHR